MSKVTRVVLPPGEGDGEGGMLAHGAPLQGHIETTILINSVIFNLETLKKCFYRSCT